MLLRELYEAPKKVAVAAFGRMNPPTIGHEKLVNAVKKQQGDHYIFLSQTQKPKDNPLPFDVKLEFAKKSFPGVNVGHPTVRTPIQMLQMLEKLGYTDVIYVAGSDRVASFDKLFNDYNGKEYNFDSITVVNAGERDPDADGAEGMSASKMRQAAAEGNLEAFSQGVPKPDLAQKMYDAVRKGMGVKDEQPVEEWAVPALKGAKYAFQISKWLWNNKWAITFFMGAWKTIDWIGDAINFAKRFLDHPVVKTMSKYGLPAIGIAIALYGGKKLYDELVQIKDERELEKLLTEFKPDMSELETLEAELEAMIADEKTNEILGFATKSPKRATIKVKKRPPEEDSVQDKLKKRRAMKAKGNPDAFKAGALDEGDLVVDKGSLVSYLRDMIQKYVMEENDVEKLSQLLKFMVGKEIKPHGKQRYRITSEDIIRALKRG